MARRRGGGAPEKDKSERWLLTYADMITLLLALFVVLFAMGRTDEEKFQQVAVSLAAGFNVPVPQGAPSGGLIPMGSIAGSGGAAGSQGSGGQGSDGLLSGGGPSPMAGLGQGLGEELKSYAEREELGDGISVRVTPDAVIVSLAGSVAFGSGNAQLRAPARAALDVVAAQLRQGQSRHLVRVEGHTDDVPPGTAAFPTNWELSAARAAGVARHLSGAGITPDRLTAVGLAETRPREDNGTAEGRARNRRVELWITRPGTPAAPAAAPAAPATAHGG